MILAPQWRAGRENLNLSIEYDMTDKPRKTLSLKSKADTPIIEEKPAQSRTRPHKRIIRRDQLPADKLATTKVRPKPKLKPKKAARPTPPKKAGVSPSDIRLHNLNAHLNNYSEAWREFKPLVIGVEKEVFRYIAEHHLSASKRVVQRLLRQHTQDERYQRNLLVGGGRYHLDGVTTN